jgi:hypothetical protein
MDDSQRALRRAAAEAFFQSLDQLGVCFEPEGEPIAAQPLTQPERLTAGSAASPQTATLQALEDAAADIEQLFGQR